MRVPVLRVDIKLITEDSERQKGSGEIHRRKRRGAVMDDAVKLTPSSEQEGGEETERSSSSSSFLFLCNLGG